MSLLKIYYQAARNKKLINLRSCWGKYFGKNLFQKFLKKTLLCLKLIIIDIWYSPNASLGNTKLPKIFLCYAKSLTWATSISKAEITCLNVKTQNTLKTDLSTGCSSATKVYLLCFNSLKSYKVILRKKFNLLIGNRKL